MTSLVTGGTGFVGGAIVQQLLNKRENVRVLARASSKVNDLKGKGVDIAIGNVMDKNTLRKAMQGVDVLYHAAAQYETWTAKPQEMFDTAVEGTRNVMQAALDAGIKKVIHTSSAAAFGLPKNQTVTETMPKPGWLPDVYYRSKYESELAARSFIGKGLDIVFLNPVNVYGPGDINKPLGRSIIQLLNGQVPSLWDANFPIVYIDDVACAHFLAAQRAKAGERFLLVERNVEYRDFFGKIVELGGGKLPSFLPHAAVLAIATGSEWLARVTKRPPLVSVMQLKSGTQGTRFDGSKAKRDLELKYTTMEEGLRKTLAWYWDRGLLKKKPKFLN